MAIDRDALKRKLEDARYRSEGFLRDIDPEKRRLYLRLGIMGSGLVVLFLVGILFVWTGGPPDDGFASARTVSDEGRSLADGVRRQLEGRPEFEGIIISPVAITGETDEYLMIYGGVPSQEAMDELRRTVEEAAPRTRVDWRIAITPPDEQLEPAG